MRGGGGIKNPSAHILSDGGCWQAESQEKPPPLAFRAMEGMVSGGDGKKLPPLAIGAMEQLAERGGGLQE